MKKNAFGVFIKIWIGLTSVFAFLVGWSALSHSIKPGATVTTAVAVDNTLQTNTLQATLTPYPTLIPVQPVSHSTGSGATLPVTGNSTNNSTAVQSFSAPKVSAQAVSAVQQPPARTSGS